LNKKTVAIALIALLATIGVAAAVGHFTLTIPTNGVVSDSELLASPSQIDWGTIAQGATVQRSFNLTNNSDQTATLNLTTATTIGAVTWDKEGDYLPAGYTTNVTVTLTIFQNASNGAFTFPLYIEG
jgi:hypothetical protein